LFYNPNKFQLKITHPINLRMPHSVLGTKDSSKDRFITTRITGPRPRFVNSNAGKIICRGITKTGNPCTRPLKDHQTRYCHYHRAQEPYANRISPTEIEELYEIEKNPNSVTAHLPKIVPLANAKTKSTPSKYHDDDSEEDPLLEDTHSDHEDQNYDPNYDPDNAGDKLGETEFDRFDE
jgi:hypothetical protein